MTAWLLALTSIQSQYLSFSSPSPLQCLFHSPLDGLVSFVRVDHRARRQTRPTLKLPSINNLNPNYKPWWRRFAILACTIGRSATLKVPSHGRTCSLHGTCSALRFRPKTRCIIIRSAVLQLSLIFGSCSQHLSVTIVS